MCKFILLGIYMINLCNISYIEPQQDSCYIYLVKTTTLKPWLEVENDKECKRTFNTIKQAYK